MQTTGGDNDAGGGAGNNQDDNNGSGDVDDKTGILVSTVAGAEVLNVNVYDAATDARVAQARSTDEVIELAPGRYNLTEYINEDFVIATAVTVRAGEVATVALGAIRVQTVAGSETITYDIYDAGGQTLLDRVNDPETVGEGPDCRQDREGGKAPARHNTWRSHCSERAVTARDQSRTPPF